MDNNNFSSGNIFNNHSKIFTPAINRNRVMGEDRVYTDVISSGLVSRIVKYQTSDSPNQKTFDRRFGKDERFSDSGFASIEPKSCLSNTFYTLPTSSMNMDKSTVTQGKTLSRILKCDSKINKSDLAKESSCENRPILHPVSIENEFAPTPSVLDVLKEISRKRINNTDSLMQKPCKKCCIRMSENEHDDCSLQDNNNETAAGDSQQLPSLHDNLTRTNKSSSSCTYRPNLKQKNDRKRLYNYNDDIRSSLSSSKRQNIYKRYKSLNNNNNSRQNSEFSEDLPQGSNIFEISGKINDTIINKDFSFNSNDVVFKEDIQNNSTENSSLTQDSSIQRTNSSQSSISIEKLSMNTENDIAHNSEKYAKPSLTLFNKIYTTENDDAKRTFQSKPEKEIDVIQFIKPRSKISTECISTNDNLRKAKLTLILDSLQGKKIEHETCQKAGEEANNQLDQNTTASIKSQSDLNVLKNKTPLEKLLPLNTNNNTLLKDTNQKETENLLPTSSRIENIKIPDKTINKTSVAFADPISTEGKDKNEIITTNKFSLKNLKSKEATTQIDENSNVINSSISLPKITNNNGVNFSFGAKASETNLSTNIAKPVFNFGFSNVQPTNANKINTGEFGSNINPISFGATTTPKNNNIEGITTNSSNSVLAPNKVGIDPSIKLNMVNNIAPVNNNYSSVNLNSFNMQPNPINIVNSNMFGSVSSFSTNIMKSQSDVTSNNNQLKLGNDKAPGGFTFNFKGVPSSQIGEQNMNNAVKQNLPAFNFTAGKPSTSLSASSKHKLFSTPMTFTGNASNNVSSNLGGFTFDKSNAATIFKGASSSDTLLTTPKPNLNTNLFGSSSANPVMACSDRPIRKATRRLQK